MRNGFISLTYLVETTPEALSALERNDWRWFMQNSRASPAPQKARAY
jgi:hypothetical protein